jgi:hypothetical protein
VTGNQHLPRSERRTLSGYAVDASNGFVAEALIHKVLLVEHPGRDKTHPSHQLTMQ